MNTPAKIRPRWILLLASLGLVLLLGACQTPGQTVYDRRQANQLMTVHYGVVERMEPVLIDGEGTIIGRLGGGVLGYEAGSRIGQGGGQRLARAAGAIAGSISGTRAEEAIKRREGTEYEILLETGARVLIVQESGEIIRVGDRVRVVSGAPGGRVHGRTIRGGARVILAED